ncbi:RIP metalloprotease RseP [Marinoscillum pacificum]|uniref:RIP metalloprotease RseP n=1 Tax=Marinoscillum pacificum TaxID=392723 RepID=UPI0021577721|nr:RIP metalloprotease RseP [Marinoscillum pacificum]
MEGLIMTAQLLLGLSILVGLHELGHLLAAKAFGMRVEKYSIGFPPKIWGKQIGETEYSIGAIPLGGFVKITGMIDESLDTKTLSAEPEPWEFRAKPAWQRLIVMLGGIIVNVITGVFIFILIVYSRGENFITKQELNKHGIVAYDLAQQLGLQTGDKMINVNGKDFEKLMDLRSPEVLLGTDGYYTVERDGQQLRVDIPNDIMDKLSDKNVDFFSVRMPFIVGQIQKESNAEKGGLQQGDKFISLNDQKIQYFDQFSAVLDDMSGKSISAVVLRDGVEKELNLDVTEEGTLGFGVVQDTSMLALSHRDFTLGESLGAGTAQAFNVVFLNIKAFGKMFSGDVSPSKSLSGPIGIAQFFGGEWDWANFWRITGLLSMVLAFMNLLPIPALDGGHVMFLTWEIVTGRKPSDKFLENAQKVGMVLLLGLMTYAIFNDVYKLF